MQYEKYENKEREGKMSGVRERMSDAIEGRRKGITRVTMTSRAKNVPKKSSLQRSFKGRVKLFFFLKFI